MTAISHSTKFYAEKKTKKKEEVETMFNIIESIREREKNCVRNRENLWKCDYDEDV
jgi:hypothetical protein